jgi:hypothetical protein
MTRNRDLYRIKNQPIPIELEEKPFEVDSIVQTIIDEHIQRAEMGFKKYGQTLDRTDLSLVDYLQHTKEELMDAVLYLEKTIQLLQGKK